MSKNSKYRIPTLQLSCELIRLVCANPEGMKRDEIEKALDISRSTAYRILQTLLSEQFIEKRGRQYLPGSALYQLSLQTGAIDQIKSRLRPVVHRLAQASGFSAHLAVPSGYQSLLLEVCDSQNLVRVASRPGTLVPLHASATGKIFLAHIFQDDIETVEQSLGFNRFTSRTKTTPEQLKKEIRQTLQRGYACDNREMNDSVRCLAAPLLDRAGVVIAAIGVTAPASEFPTKLIDQVALMVKAHARECYVLEPQR